MRKTIYKWGQYYLMYSPVWKQLTKHNKINWIKNNNQISHQSHKRDLVQDNKPNETSRQLEIKTLKQLCQKKPFNIRLSMAYNVLFQKSLSNSVQNENELMNNIFASEQFWIKQRAQIASEIKQLTHKIKDTKKYINPNKQGQIENVVDQLFRIGVCSNVSRAVQERDHSYFDQKQYELKRQQNIYDTVEIKKRILINQVINFIQLPIVNKQSFQAQSFGEMSMEFTHTQGLTDNKETGLTSNEDKILLMQVLVKLVDNFFKERVLYLQEEEINDWIATLFRQTNCLQIVTDQVFMHLSQAVYPSIDSYRYSSSQIHELLHLYSGLGQLVGSLQKLFQLKSKITSQTNQQQIQQFITYFKTFTQQNRLISKSLSQQITKILTIKQSLQIYHKISSGQAQQKEFTKYKNKLQQTSLQKANSKKQKQTKPKTCKPQFNLWKLHYLIHQMIQLDSFHNLNSSSISSTYSLIHKHFQAEISNILQALSQSITTRPNIAMNRQVNDVNQFSLTDSISLVSICEFMISYQPKGSDEQGSFRKFRSSIFPSVKKINQTHIKLIFNHKFQQQPIHQIISILNNITHNDHQILQVLPYKFQILKKTQILSNLFKNLHILIVKEKQHIILAKQDKIILTKCIQFFCEHKYSSNIFGKQERQHIDKILDKIKS